jgi:hypothetical protein
VVGTYEHGNKLQVPNFSPAEIQSKKDCAIGVFSQFKEVHNMYWFLAVYYKKKTYFFLIQDFMQSCINFLPFCRNTLPTTLLGRQTQQVPQRKWQIADRVFDIIITADRTWNLTIIDGIEATLQIVKTRINPHYIRIEIFRFTSQRKRCASIRKNNPLILYKKIMGVYSDNSTEDINALHRRNAMFSMLNILLSVLSTKC